MSSLLEKQADLLSAMANAKRLQVLLLISNREWNVADLAQAVDLSQSALSQHLAKLRKQKLVQTRREKQTVFYNCRSAKVLAILSCLELISEKLCEAA